MNKTFNKHDVIRLVKDTFEQNLRDEDYQTIINKDDYDRYRELRAQLTLAVQVVREFATENFYDFSSDLADEILDSID